VYTYAFTLDGIRLWVSLVTREFAANDNGTRLTHTEQYAYLAYTADGQQDVAHLQDGTRLQLNALAAALGTPT
jgi:ferric-dicitrate binding protein FerR (iron transport regulator)